jgi:hypothetical protein
VTALTARAITCESGTPRAFAWTTTTFVSLVDRRIVVDRQDAVHVSPVDQFVEVIKENGFARFGLHSDLEAVPAGRNCLTYRRCQAVCDRCEHRPGRGTGRLDGDIGGVFSEFEAHGVATPTARGFILDSAASERKKVTVSSRRALNQGRSQSASGLTRSAVD